MLQRSPAARPSMAAIAQRLKAAAFRAAKQGGLEALGPLLLRLSVAGAPGQASRETLVSAANRGARSLI